MPAIDNFDGNSTWLNGPANDAFAITPDDVNELPYVTRAIYVGQGGNVKLVTRKGSTVTYWNVPTGTTIHQRAKQVLATVTGPAAALMVGMV